MAGGGGPHVSMDEVAFIGTEVMLMGAGGGPSVCKECEELVDMLCY